MVVIPGLSESLSAVGKRIIRFDTADTLLSVEAASAARSTRCPKCSHRSSRRKGQCRRRLNAEPCLGSTLSLSVEVRRFKCVNRQCTQATFAEQINALASPKQRRTVGLNGLRHNAKLREAAQRAVVSPLSQTQPAGADPALPLMAWRKLSSDRRAARLARYEEVPPPPLPTRRPGPYQRSRRLARTAGPGL